MSTKSSFGFLTGIITLLLWFLKRRFPELLPIELKLFWTKVVRLDCSSAERQTKEVLDLKQLAKIRVVAQDLAAIRQTGETLQQTLRQLPQTLDIKRRQSISVGVHS